MTIQEAIKGFEIDNTLLAGTEDGVVERNNLAIAALKRQNKKNTKVDVKTVKCDGWESLYINRELHGEGHHIEISDFCNMLNTFLKRDDVGINDISYSCHWVREDYIETSGCPVQFKDIPDSVFE